MVGLFFLVVIVGLSCFFLTKMLEKKPELDLAKVEKLAAEGKAASKDVKEGLFWSVRTAGAVGVKVTAFEELEAEKAAKTKEAESLRDAAEKTVDEAAVKAEELRAEAKRVEALATVEAGVMTADAVKVEGRIVELEELEELLK